MQQALKQLGLTQLEHALPALFETARQEQWTYDTNLRSEWYNRGINEGGEENLFWERESHEPQLIFQ
jgi:hypothetical protein